MFKQYSQPLSVLFSSMASAAPFSQAKAHNMTTAHITDWASVTDTNFREWVWASKYP